MKTLYLNNSGSRWINIDKQAMQVLLIHKAENYKKVRQVEFFEGFGNFASCTLKYKGKRISVLPNTFADEETGLPVCYVDYTEKYA